MSVQLARRILFVVVGAAVLVVFGIAAYQWGVTNANAGSGPAIGRGFRGGGPMMGSGMRAGYDVGWTGWAGFGWLGLLGLGLLLLGILVVWLVIAAASRRRVPGSTPSGMPPGASTDPSGMGHLRELAEMHARGELTDEEFTAAKRKLLGL